MQLMKDITTTILISALMLVIVANLLLRSLGRSR